MINVALIEYESYWRDFYINLISNTDDYKMCGSSSSALRLFSILRSENVNVVLLDIHCPDYVGKAMMKEINERSPSVKLIAIVEFMTHTLMAELIDVGFKGIIHKTKTSKSEILLTIEKIINGKRYIAQYMDI